MRETKEMLDRIREAIDRLEEERDRPVVVLLSPKIFEEFFRLIQELHSGLPEPSEGRFVFDGSLVVEHRYLPVGSGYIVDLEEAEKVLGFRPGFNA